MKQTARRVRKGSPGVRHSGRLAARSAGSLSGRAAQIGFGYPPIKQGPKMIGGVRQR